MLFFTPSAKSKVTSTVFVFGGQTLNTDSAKFALHVCGAGAKLSQGFTAAYSPGVHTTATATVFSLLKPGQTLFKAVHNENIWNIIFSAPELS